MEISFSPMESHMPFMLQHFNIPKSVVSAPLAGVRSGDVLVVNPHLMLAFGPNLEAQENLILQVNVVPQAGVADLSVPSWIKGWRSSRSSIHFGASAVFPPLHTTRR
jgi:hypothetical protein